MSKICRDQLSHDSISRRLKDQKFQPKEIFETVKHYVNMEEPRVLIVDDTGLSKMHRKKIKLVNDQYFGNVHDVIADIGWTNLLWYGIHSATRMSVADRMYDKDSNAHCLERLKPTHNRGFNLQLVVIDAWYSSIKNLKPI